MGCGFCYTQGARHAAISKAFQNKANPTAMLLTSVDLLRHLGYFICRGVCVCACVCVRVCVCVCVCAEQNLALWPSFDVHSDTCRTIVCKRQCGQELSF